MGDTLEDFLDKLRNNLNFLNAKEREQIVKDYRVQIEKEVNNGKKEKDVIKNIEPIDKIVKEVCQEHNLDYDYCIRSNGFDKSVIGLSTLIAEFIRSIIKVVRKVKLGTSLESFLEVVIKIIVLLFLFVFAKLPFILLEELFGFINRFIFYPFNDSFNLAVRLILSLAYLVMCVIITLRIFGNYHPKARKIVKKEELEKVNKEYNWLELIIRIVIYLLVLIPLIIISVATLVLLIETSYLVTQGIKLIGISIILVGLFGMFLSLIGVVYDSMKHKDKSYLVAIILSVVVFSSGVFIAVDDFSNFKYPNNLTLSSIKATEEEVDIELDDSNTIIDVELGEYDLLLDNNLADNQIKVVASYYDDYIDVIYGQEMIDNVNHLVFKSKVDSKINYFNMYKNVIKDLQNGYLFNYSNVKKIQLKVYANDVTKANLEKK